MALPWHIPLQYVPAPVYKETNAPQPSVIKHYCKLNIKDSPIDELQTGLMCDIVTGNREPAAIQRLIDAGMTIARVALHDLSPDSCSQLIQGIRQAVLNYSTELEYVYPLPIILQIKGPDVITGNLKGGPKETVEVFKRGTLRLTNDVNWLDSGTSDCLYIDCQYLTEFRPGDTVFIDSLTPGNIKLIVSKVGDNSTECEVVTGGTIGPKMAVRIAQVPREKEELTTTNEDGDNLSRCEDTRESNLESVKEQLAFAIASDLDGVLIPNVQVPGDLRKIKAFCCKRGKNILVFACIETSLGFENIDHLLDIADGLYFDRNVLSTDLPVERVFIAQKVILSKCNDAGKPCICGAVINEQIPTLCATDIANLVLDGVDVLSLEMHYNFPFAKATSSFDPLLMAERCLAATSVICRNAERIIWQPRIYSMLELMQSLLEQPTKAMCVSAVELAMRSRAVIIICLTKTGRTAKVLSRMKPFCPIVAVTRECYAARQLRFWRGVRAMHYFDAAKANYLEEVDSRIHAGLDYCKAKNILRCGDAYVILTTSRKGVGYCDSVRLLYASARNTIVLVK